MEQETNSIKKKNVNKEFDKNIKGINNVILIKENV